MPVAPSAALVSATINPVVAMLYYAIPTTQYVVKYVGKEEGF